VTSSSWDILKKSLICFLHELQPDIILRAGLSSALSLGACGSMARLLAPVQEKLALVVDPLRVHIYRNNQNMIVIVAVRRNSDDNFLSR
jgi:hypothetical protein